MAEETKKDPIAERKKAEIKDGFLNPFGEQTSYDEFQEAVKTSKLSIDEYCKGKISEDELNFIKKELSIINKK